MLNVSGRRVGVVFYLIIFQHARIRGIEWPHLVGLDLGAYMTVPCIKVFSEKLV